MSAFGSYEDFKTAFTGYASGHFGSGWAWLMMHEDGSVDVRNIRLRRSEERLCSTSELSREPFLWAFFLT